MLNIPGCGCTLLQMKIALATNKWKLSSEQAISWHCASASELFIESCRRKMMRNRWLVTFDVPGINSEREFNVHRLQVYRSRLPSFRLFARRTYVLRHPPEQRSAKTANFILILKALQTETVKWIEYIFNTHLRLVLVRCVRACIDAEQSTNTRANHPAATSSHATHNFSFSIRSFSNCN